MSPSPRGGTMLILNIKILRKVNSALNLHTNIIYINIYYKRGNPTKPTETTFSQLFRNETNPSPKRPFAMLYLCIVKTRKTRFFNSRALFD